MGCAESSESRRKYEEPIGNSRTILNRDDRNKFLIIVGDLSGIGSFAKKYREQAHKLRTKIEPCVGEENVRLLDQPSLKTFHDTVSEWINSDYDSVARVEICFIGLGGQEFGDSTTTADSPSRVNGHANNSNYFLLNKETKITRLFFQGLLKHRKKPNPWACDREVFLYSFVNETRNWLDNPTLGVGDDRNDYPWKITLQFNSKGISDRIWDDLDQYARDRSFYRRLLRSDDKRGDLSLRDFKIDIFKQGILNCFITYGHPPDHCTSGEIHKIIGLPELCIWIDRLDLHPNACPDPLAALYSDIATLRVLMAAVVDDSEYFEGLRSRDTITDKFCAHPRVEAMALKFLNSQKRENVQFDVLLDEYQEWRRSVGEGPI